MGRGGHVRAPRGVLVVHRPAALRAETDDMLLLQAGVRAVRFTLSSTTFIKPLGACVRLTTQSSVQSWSHNRAVPCRSRPLSSDLRDRGRSAFFHRICTMKSIFS
eukprot:3900126-Pyramimonas_sp.AAC.1